MEPMEFVELFNINSNLDYDLLCKCTNDRVFSERMVDIARAGNCLALSQAFLNNEIERTKKEISGFSPKLRLACLLVAEHREVKSALDIWRAKTINFDTYCGIDVQLLVSSGVNEVLAFLSKLNTEESDKAISYIKGCRESGDFDELESYYSASEYPWYIDDE